MSVPAPVCARTGGSGRPTGPACRSPHPQKPFEQAARRSAPGHSLQPPFAVVESGPEVARPHSSERPSGEDRRMGHDARKPLDSAAGHVPGPHEPHHRGTLPTTGPTPRSRPRPHIRLRGHPARRARATLHRRPDRYARSQRHRRTARAQGMRRRWRAATGVFVFVVRLRRPGRVASNRRHAA